MKVTIAGAGASGSYLARVIHREHEVKLYDGNTSRGCRCAWGSTYSLLEEKMRAVGLRLSDYTLCVPEQGYVNGVEHGFSDAVIFDKRKFVEDLTEGINITPKYYDFKRKPLGVVINATGKPFGKPRPMNYTVQWKMRLSGARERTTYLWMKPKLLGYGWAFPLTDEGKTFHVGAGAFNSYYDAAHLAFETLKHYSLEAEKFYCACHRPLYIGRFPLIGEQGAISIGEAAGCVFPAAGEGILPSIESAQFLAEALNENMLPLYFEKMKGFLESYREPYVTIQRLKKRKHFAMIKLFKILDERSKMRTKPSFTRVNKLRLFLKLVFGG